MEGIILKKAPLWTKDFTSLCFSSFFLFMTFYILLTTLPFFILERLHEAEESVGLATTTFLIASVLIRPFAGKWLETLNRKKIILTSLLGTVFISIFYLFVHSFTMLLTLRFLQGLAFGLATTATSAIAAEIVPKSRKGEGIGYFSLSMTLAMVFGPFLGLTIIQYTSFNILFMSIVFFAIISFSLGTILKIPPVPKATISTNKTESKKFTIHNYIEVAAIPIASSAAIFGIAYSSLLSYIPLFAAEIHLQSIASFFFIVFAFVVILSRPFTGKWYDLYGANKLIYPALIVFTSGFLLLSMTNNAFLFFFSAAVIALGYGATLPSFQTMAIESVPIHRSGMATSTFFLLFDIGFGLGSFVNGLIAAKFGYSLMFIICAIFSVLSMVLYYLLSHRSKTQNNNVLIH